MRPSHSRRLLSCQTANQAKNVRHLALWFNLKGKKGPVGEGKFQ